MHHYTFALMCLPMVWFPHWWPVMLNGFANGVLVEGAARWGYDPVWIKIDQPEEAQKLLITKPLLSQKIVDKKNKYDGDGPGDFRKKGL